MSDLDSRMPRDRQLTAARILAAAESLITRGGVGAVGINAVAEAAGVDKVLIYRYFGGRAQLLRALARERRLWPEIEIFAPADGETPALADDLTAILIAHARALRAHPLARRAAAWQLAERDELARDAAAARDAHVRAIATALRARHRIPPFVDLEAMIALLWAGVTHLAMHGGAGAPFAGLDLRREEDWSRAERALSRTIHALLGAGDE